MLAIHGQCDKEPSSCPPAVRQHERGRQQFQRSIPQQSLLCHCYKSSPPIQSALTRDWPPHLWRWDRQSRTDRRGHMAPADLHRLVLRALVCWWVPSPRRSARELRRRLCNPLAGRLNHWAKDRSRWQWLASSLQRCRQSPHTAPLYKATAPACGKRLPHSL